MLVDSHCHLTDDRYSDDRWEVLARASAAGVGRVIAIGSDVADAERVRVLLEMASEREGLPDLWGTAGVHPHEAEKARPGDMERVREAVVGSPRMVAVGETGLDFFYDNSPRPVQEALFREHLVLASELNLPVVVHSREADDLTGEILDEWAGRVRGVLHCFTGGKPLLDTALRSGWMISLTGIITFKKYDRHELVRSIPRDRLMIETDGPYLAPTPFRGRRNEPAYVGRVAEALAAILGEDEEEVSRFTTENAIRFFGLEG